MESSKRCLIDLVTINFPKKNKEKYRKRFGELGYDLDAPEQGITDMVLRWAVGGLAESLPFMAAPLAGGLAGAEYVPPEIRKIPIFGKKIGSLCKNSRVCYWFYSAGMPQFFGGNLERQMEEGRLTAEELNKPGGFGTAILSSASDSLLFALLGRYGGTLQKTTAIEVSKHIAKATALGASTEGFTGGNFKVALERAQAGLTINPADEEAFREFINSGLH